MTVPLTAEDRAILALEGPTVVGHTCKVIRLGPGEATAAGLRAAVGRRLAGAPRLTWRLGGPPDRPEWHVDPAFDVRDHIAEARSTAELDDVALGNEVARLFEQHLDRRRPLWRMDLLGPLAGGGTALVWRLHHALADGTTAMRLARTVLWDSQADGPPGARPAPPAARTQAVDDARRRHHLAGFLEREFLPSTRRSPFDLPIGPDRGVAFAMTALGRLRASARTLAGATVNDAVLAVMAGALRTWIVHRHGPLHPVRVRVPVSLHNEREPTGNRDSYFCVSLPLDEPDPVARLVAVRRETALRKSRHDAQEMAELLDRLGRASPRLRRWCSELQAAPRAFALNVSNVPGPRQQVSVLGVDVETIHSIAEVGERHALRAAVVSVGDRLCFGLCADRGVIGDLDVLAAAIEQEAMVMAEAAGLVADR
ncbi:wax ester/triacylglycerol synthase domain-containing protein [Pseudonocardia xinjiangensis]|uniref:wax ester/triacylglycerol synthase domain-containing protein n=1 Tax=Pseudonocardia xinjiangensis TaxID=75289 RepID=UPI003D9328A2